MLLSLQSWVYQKVAVFLIIVNIETQRKLYSKTLKYFLKYENSFLQNFLKSCEINHCFLYLLWLNYYKFWFFWKYRILLSSQRFPSKPSGQSHLKSFTKSVHVPFCWHGLGSHSLISVEQFRSVKPGLHEQEYVSNLLKHDAPFWQGVRLAQ